MEKTLNWSDIDTKNQLHSLHQALSDMAAEMRELRSFLSSFAAAQATNQNALLEINNKLNGLFTWKQQTECIIHQLSDKIKKLESEQMFEVWDEYGGDSL